VHDLHGKLRAVYVNYACHCVTLSNNKISGGLGRLRPGNSSKRIIRGDRTGFRGAAAPTRTPAPA